MERMWPGSQPVTTTRRRATGVRLSGIAPRAYLGNYKALGDPEPSSVRTATLPSSPRRSRLRSRDGMDVINLSLGETEIEPRRDAVVTALNAAADAGVVAAVSAGNDFDQYGYGTITSPANAAKVISVARVERWARQPRRGFHRELLLCRPDALFADVQAGRHRPGRRRRISRTRAAATSSSAERACRHRTSAGRRPCCASGIRPGRRKTSGRHCALTGRSSSQREQRSRSTHFVRAAAESISSGRSAARVLPSDAH